MILTRLNDHRTMKHVSDYGLLRCLQHVAEFYGLSVQSADMARKIPSLLAAATEDLDMLEHLYGLEARTLSIRLSHLAARSAPFVVQVGDRFLIGYKKRRWGKISLHDPADACALSEALPSGRRVKVILLRPALQAQPGQGRPSDLHMLQLLLRARGVKSTLWIVVLVSICLEILNIATPLQTQWIIDQALPVSDKGLIYFVALVFGIAISIQTLFMAARTKVLAWLKDSLGLQLTVSLFSRLLRVPVTFFKEHSAGDIVSTFSALQNVLRSFTANFVSSIFDGVMSLVLLGLLIWLNWKIGLILLSIVGVYSVMRALRILTTESARKQALKENAENQLMIIESARGISGIKVSHVERQFTRRFLESAKNNIGISRYLERSSNSFSHFNFWLLGMQRVLILMLASLQVIQGDFSVGMMVAYLMYAQQFSTRMSSFVDKMSDVASLKASLQKVSMVLEQEVAREYARSFVGSCDSTPLSVLDVCFRYQESMPLILDHCSIEIPFEARIGIAGRTGLGKSTLIKVILGLNAVDSGTITLGGQTIVEMGGKEWRRKIGAVQQDDVVYTGTVAENISMFDEEENFQRVVECAHIAQIHDEIERMEYGYATQVSGSYSSLSGGQRQRLFIARALYRHPSILILDEATANLDGATESAILDSLLRLPIGLVMISHRKETLARMSCVYDMVDGRLTLRSTHLASPGRSGEGTTAPLELL